MISNRGQLAKVRGRSLDELQVRGKQALAIFAERRGWSTLVKLPSDRSLAGMLESPANRVPLNSKQEVFEHFERRTHPQFFSAFNNREITIGAFRERWPGAAEQIIERAKRIIAGSFDLLGFEGLRFGEPINWHFEPIGGKGSPQIHWSLFEELDVEHLATRKLFGN